MNTENKDISQYLHLYLGCEVIFTRTDVKRELTVGVLAWSFERDDVKPILRKLSDMSEEEKMDLHWKNQSPEQLRWMKEDNYAIKCSEFKYLLSKHFDLFGLIEAGLAIDKTTIK